MIEYKPEGKVTASLIGWPDGTAQGGTEADAASVLRLRLRRIAAITLASAANLVTRNTRDFAQVPGLLIGDWAAT